MKLLLNLFDESIQEKDYFNLSEVFENKGYLVFTFHFPISDYSLDIVDKILNYLIVEHNVSPYDSKIVIQSNIYNLLFSWYRLYNDVIDEFVLVDQQIVSFHAKDKGEEALIAQLSSFAAIEDDPCHDRLYYRYSRPISFDIVKLFIESYQYDLLKPFDQFKLLEVYEKKKIAKEYRFEKWNCKKITEGDSVDVIIDLNKRRKFQNNILINKVHQVQGFYFIFLYIMDLHIAIRQKEQIVMFLNQRMSEKDKQKVTKYLLNYLEVTESELSFKKVINFYTFLISLGSDKTILKNMFKYIVKDENHLDDQYAIITNALFYITKGNQKEYEDYFLDRIKIMSKLKEHYKKKVKIKASTSNNHLVIVVGQLLSYNHAPTKIAIDYANNLIKYNSKLKIKIIVEDMFNYSPNELFFVYSFSSADSKSLSKEHKKLFNPSIEVHYSNSRLPREQRLQEDINAITNFQPQWILKIGAPDSLVVDQLYDYYPVTSFSMGGAEYSEFVDVAIGGRSKEATFREINEKGLSSFRYHYFKHTPGIEFQKPKSFTSRESLNLEEEDFVIVTVGNRLDAEMDDMFINGMKTVLSHNKHVKWLLIGLERHKLINDTFGELLKQVRFLRYAQDLMSVYSICDMYANPFRKGGGISVAMAMFAGLPVANLEGTNDANIYIPKGKAKSLYDYFSYIENLIKDKEFLNTEKEVFQETIKENFGFQSATKHIIELLGKSEVIFLERKKL
ncbi:glycosyltransferase [Bacillus smithii]|uniref:glycosyltransferase n=1 Tax=Bacillus smithii TaxID=1479 RepID=UPI002E20A2C5|nr:glycosyltransferase [Bacillus smithii]MED4926578.1 glycosyltransferase [Bacillus smithii]